MKKYVVLVALLLTPVVSFASIDVNLKYGSTGPEVIELQEYLIDKGFLKIIATGNFYSLTRTAVVAYQTSVGLPATGFVGPMTRERINADLALGTSEEEAQAPVVTTPSNDTSALKAQLDALLLQVQALVTEQQKTTQATNKLVENTTPVFGTTPQPTPTPQPTAPSPTPTPTPVPPPTPVTPVYNLSILPTTSIVKTNDPQANNINISIAKIILSPNGGEPLIIEKIIVESALPSGLNLCGWGNGGYICSYLSPNSTAGTFQSTLSTKENIELTLKITDGLPVGNYTVKVNDVRVIGTHSGEYKQIQNLPATITFEVK